MKRLIVALLLFLSMLVTPAQADWRWANPTLKKQTVTYSCNTMVCIEQSFAKAKHRFKKRVKRYHQARLREWNRWTNLYIPTCSWYGESGEGPQYAQYRYTVMNSTGSGARGKFQFMPSTYFSRAKYADWSPLDQEIAARREYWANGTTPWSNCHR